MSNEQNLKPINSVEMAREYQKKSVESRKRNQTDAKKRAFRELIESMLSESGGGLNGKPVTRKEMVTAKAIKILLDNETTNMEFFKAFEIIRDTIGEKPIEKIMTAEVDQDIIDEVEKAVLESDEHLQ